MFDLDSDHKKPYETLVLGRAHSSSLPCDQPDLLSRARSGDSHSHCGQEEATSVSSSCGQCKVVGSEKETSNRQGDCEEEEEEEEEMRPCKVIKLESVSC